MKPSLSNDLKLVLLLIFGLFAFCDFVVNLIQVECLYDILFCKVELLKLAACLDNRALLQSSAVLHQNNCGKLLGHRVSSYFEFLRNIVMSANIDFSKFKSFARILTAELRENRCNFLALRRPRGIETDEPVSFRAFLEVVEVFDGIRELDSVIREKIQSDDAKDHVEKAKVDIHPPEKIRAREFGKLKCGGISLIPAQSAAITDNDDTREKHESFHFSPVKVAWSILGTWKNIAYSRSFANDEKES